MKEIKKQKKGKKRQIGNKQKLREGNERDKKIIILGEKKEEKGKKMEMTQMINIRIRDKHEND